MKKTDLRVVPAYNEERNMLSWQQLKEAFSANPGYDFELSWWRTAHRKTYERCSRSASKPAIQSREAFAQLSQWDGGITAGLRYARGDAAVIMTATLQDKPSIIPDFIQKWEEGYENVYGIVKRRPGKGLLRRLNRNSFTS